MGLIRKNQVESVIGAGPLTLTMPANNSALITDVRIHDDAAAAEDYDLNVDTRRVQQFIAPAAWNLIRQNFSGEKEALTRKFWEAGLFPKIPVGKGQVAELSGLDASHYAELVYELYDADDIRPTMPNGSDSPIQEIFQVVSNSATVIGATSTVLDRSDLDSPFQAFPGGASVPAGKQVKLLGLFGNGASVGTGAAIGQFTTHLRLVLDGNDILDRSRNGMLYVGDESRTAAGVGYITDASRLHSVPADREPGIVLFDPPFIFGEGQTLDVILTINLTNSVTFAIGDLAVGMLLRFEPLGRF